jgi:hypothetical protein
LPFSEAHLVVVLGAGHVLDLESGSDFDALHRADSEHASEFGVELVEDRLAEARRGSHDDHFDEAAGGIALGGDRVAGLHHLLAAWTSGQLTMWWTP